MEHDNKEPEQSGLPRIDEGGGHAEHPTSQAEDRSENRASESDSSDLESMAANVRHSGPEHKESAEYPLEGEIVSPEVMNQVVRAVTSMWSGPTPSPETLRDFNEVDPTFAERAFKMSEETVSTSNYERRVLADGDVTSVKRGQWMAWSGSLLGMGCAIGSVYLGHEVVGLAFLTPAFFQFFGSFIRTVRNGDSSSSSSSSSEVAES
ncbi:hypothetical protein ACWIB8_06225 [Corynebacterium flavescens]